MNFIKKDYGDGWIDFEDKCPQCGEGFVAWKGGTQCVANYCSEKALEEKHKQVAKPMVDYVLPNKGVKLEHPNDLSTDQVYVKGWGWTYDTSNKIIIPWYTLRNKKRFFNNVSHESGHILAYQRKFAWETERKIIERYFAFAEEYNNLPSQNKTFETRQSYAVRQRNYYQNNKKVIDFYLDPNRPKQKGGQQPRWTHGEKYFYSSYVHCFNSLIKSPYVQYNYDNSTQPKSFDEVRFYKPLTSS
jgi:hypothetical protein